MRTLIFRDFAEYDENGNVVNSDGSLSIYINNFSIEIIIDGLCFGNTRQVFMSIKYASDIDLYDAVLQIMDKISYDLYYKTNVNPNDYRDFILHDHMKKKNKKIWNRNREKNSIGSEWIPYTRENMKHVTIDNEEMNFGTDSITRGEVDANGVFIYDFI